MRTDEVASVLELRRELREIELALELATLDLAKSDRLDFLGWSEGAYDSPRERRGSEGGGRSGRGLSTGVSKRFRCGVLKTCTGITGADLDELARLDVVRLSTKSGEVSGE